MASIENHPLRAGISLSYMFFAVFLIVTLFGALLFQIGSPGRFVAQLMLTFVVSSYIFMGIFAKTMGMNTFQFADRQATTAGSAQALASGVISTGIFVLLAGEFYVSGNTAFSSYWGWLAGTGLIIVLFAAFVTRSGKVTIPSFLQDEKPNPALSIITIVATLTCCTLFLLLQLEFVTRIGEQYFYISRTAAVYAVSVAIGFAVLAGGIQSTALIRQISFPVILTCFMVPLVWVAVKVTGMPVPQLALGAGALAPVAEIDRELLEAGLAQSGELFDMTRQSGDPGVFNYFSGLLCIACGIAAMPHLLQHFSTLQKGRQARRSGYLSFILIFIFLSAVPAVAAFAKLDLYTSLLGLQVADLGNEADWLFSLSGAGKINLISICGSFVANVDQAVSACGDAPGYFLSVKDISVNAGMLTLASPALHQMPELVSAVLATGAILALFTTIDGLFLTMGLTISNDGYRSLFRPKSPKSVRLFMTRIFIILVIILAAYLTLSYRMDPRVLFETSFALTAASLFPVLVMRIWISSSTQNMMVCSTLLGFVSVITLLVLTNFGYDFAFQNGDEIIFHVPGSTTPIPNFGIGVLGMLVAFLPAFLPWFKRGVKSTDKEPDTDNATA